MKTSFWINLLFPKFLFGLNNVEETPPGKGDDKSDDGDKDIDIDENADDDAKKAAAAAAAKALADAANVTLTKKEHDSLMGRLGDLEGKERQRATEVQKKADLEKIKAGKQNEVIAEKEKSIAELSPYKDRFIKRITNDHNSLLKSIEKVDEKIKARFRVAEAGKELSLDDMEFNIAKFDEFTELGVLSKSADGKTIVTADEDDSSGKSKLIIGEGEKGKGFDAWG